jgi:uncharacterized delta-60 repeat protein
MSVAVLRSFAGAVLAFSAAAAVAGWSLTLPDGKKLAIVNDGTAGPSAQHLERRNPDGSPDGLFGSAGRVVFSLGADSPGPRSLRSDALGRLLVVGTAVGADGRAMPASMRFLFDGRLDLTWGTQGRSAVPVRDADALGADLLAMPDESVLLLGQIDGESTEHAALWRLTRNGALDTGFGQGGIMRATGLEPSQPLALALDDDGAALIALQTAQQGRPWLEVHRWQAGQDQPQRVARQPMPAEWQGPPMLQRRGGAWQWFDASQPISQGGVPLMAVAATAVWTQGGKTAPTGALATPATTEGSAAFNPFEVTADKSSAAPVGSASSGANWVVLALLSLAVLAGLGWWRWHRR